MYYYIYVSKAGLTNMDFFKWPIIQKAIVEGGWYKINIQIYGKLNVHNIS